MVRESKRPFWSTFDGSWSLPVPCRTYLLLSSLVCPDQFTHHTDSRLDTVAGELWVRPAPKLAGLIEVRGLGIRNCDYTKEALVGLIVDLAATDAERLPPPEALSTHLNGVVLPRIPVGAGFDPLPLIAAALTTTAGSAAVQPSHDCLKGIGNHISPNIATD